MDEWLICDPSAVAVSHRARETRQISLFFPHSPWAQRTCWVANTKTVQWTDGHLPSEVAVLI